MGISEGRYTVTNGQRAAALIQKYGFAFSAIPKAEIQALLEQEIRDFQAGSAEYIRLLCAYLYGTGDASDVPLMEAAKQEINMDVGCMIDQEWIDSLKKGGRKGRHVRSRAEILQDIVDYYRDFEADDLW